MPRRRLRTRLALFYGGVFLVASAVLLAVAFLPAVRISRTSRVGAGDADAHAASNLHQVLGYSGIALAAAAVLAAALGWLAADRALRPLRTITRSARAISASNLHERLGLNASYDEFTELGETLDGLFGRLEASFESQRQFVANASHELRTPLAAERTLLQVTLADPGATAETLRSACEQLLGLGAQQERLIDALLTLASSQRGIERWEPVDIAAITANVLAARGEETARRGIRVDAAVGPAIAPGDPRLMESMVANLADNALRYNVTGGIVEIGTSMTAGSASLWIANTGPVIPAAEIGRLFQPFQQLGADRIGRDGDGGYGLGLAIVQAIAIAHGASLSARARPGGGLEIRVDFDRLMGPLSHAKAIGRPNGSKGSAD
jgi:signal transduction histidine kinase